MNPSVLLRRVTPTLTTGVEATDAPLAEEPLGLAGDADGAGFSLFPLAAAAECEMVNLKLPDCVLFGRFSLSSLSLTVMRREKCAM